MKRCNSVPGKYLRAVTLLVLLSLLGAGTPVQAQQATPTAGDPGPERAFDITHVKLNEGYRIEALISNLSVPTTAAFDGNNLLLVESGWANTAPPRVLRITPDWTVTEIASAGLEGPVTGVLAHNGQVFVSHAGKVSVVEAGGALRDIVTGLPSKGDHHNNNIALGPDGKIYMGQGTVTNAGVVGVDNYIFGWLDKNADVHEIPCKDITLVGENFETENPLTPEDDKVTTGAYKPFGTPSKEGETIKGDPKCGGSIVRFNPDGSGFELVAWGLRNPFGLEFDGQGKLWSAYHGADVRGSRSIFDDPDYMVQVKEGAWYGWPDFFDGDPVTADRFDDITKPKPNTLWTEHPPLEKPFTTFDPHAGANGIDFSPGGTFGMEGDAFVAMFGSFAPVTTGPNVTPSGFSVARINMEDGTVHDFISNNVPGPAYINQTRGLDRPSDVVFAPDSSMYIIDWGASTVTDEGLKLTPLTGAVWRVYKDGQPALRPDGPLKVVAPPQIPEEARKPEVRNVPEAWRELLPLLALGGGAILLLGAAIFLGVRAMGRRRTQE
jgi:glucose/arabinose dehydrogenase